MGAAGGNPRALSGFLRHRRRLLALQNIGNLGTHVLKRPDRGHTVVDNMHDYCSAIVEFYERAVLTVVEHLQAEYRSNEIRTESERQPTAATESIDSLQLQPHLIGNRAQAAQTLQGKIVELFGPGIENILRPLLLQFIEQLTADVVEALPSSFPDIVDSNNVKTIVGFYRIRQRSFLECEQTVDKLAGIVADGHPP